MKENGSSYGKTLWCNANVFKVTEGQTTTISGSHSQGVSKELKNIQLTLEKCEEDGNRKHCSIKIGDEVGLSWRDGFKLKVILQSSRE